MNEDVLENVLKELHIASEWEREARIPSGVAKLLREHIIDMRSANVSRGDVDKLVGFGRLLLRAVEGYAARDERHFMRECFGYSSDDLRALLSRIESALARDEESKG